MIVLPVLAIAVAIQGEPALESWDTARNVTLIRTSMRLAMPLEGTKSNLMCSRTVYLPGLRLLCRSCSRR